MQLIAKGAYGKVFKKDKTAIKFINIYDKELDLTFFDQNTLMEIACLKELSHPHIIRLIDVYHDDKYMRITMPLAEQTLYSLINSDEELNISHLSFQLASAINFCHSKNIIHRDIKPQNILVFRRQSSPILKLADFGISSSQNNKPANNKSLCYTVYYRPPEVLFDSDNTDKSDIWALGCVIAEMYTKKPYFKTISEDIMVEYSPSLTAENIRQLFAVFMGIGIPKDQDVDFYKVWKERKQFRLWSIIEPHLKEWEGNKFYNDFKNNSDLYSLLQGCFTFNPEKRFSALDILNHPFISKEHDFKYIPYTKEEIIEKNGVIFDTVYDEQVEIIATNYLGEFIDLCLVHDVSYDVMAHSIYLYLSYVEWTREYSSEALKYCLVISCTYFYPQNYPELPNLITNRHLYFDILYTLDFRILFSTPISLLADESYEANLFVVCTLLTHLSYKHSITEIANAAKDFTNNKKSKVLLDVINFYEKIENEHLKYFFNALKNTENYKNIF